MKIRKAKRQDISQIADLVLDLHKFHSRLDKKYRIKPDSVCLKHIKKDLRKFFKKPKDRDFLVAEEDNKIVGYAEIIIEKKPLKFLGKDGWIYSIHIDKKYQGRRIGTQLVRESAKMLKRKGIKEINLSYILKNKEADRFWKLFKFQKCSINGVIDIDRILRNP